MLCGSESQEGQGDEHVSQKRRVDIKFNLVEAEFPGVLGEESGRISPLKLGICAVCCLIIDVGSFMVSDHRRRSEVDPEITLRPMRPYYLEAALDRRRDKYKSNQHQAHTFDCISHFDCS